MKKLFSMVGMLVVLLTTAFVFSRSTTSPGLSPWVEQAVGMISHIAGLMGLGLVCVTMVLCVLAGSGVMETLKQPGLIDMNGCIKDGEPP